MRNLITTVDVETSWQKTENGGYDPSPFHEDNILVSVGINDDYYFTNHSERIDVGCASKIQSVLNKTTLLVGHNIKFDLMWLLEAGFKYNGRVYDTMLGEYILNRGIRKSLTLEMCCRRRKIGSKDSAIKEWTDRGISFQNIPKDVVEEYGRIDVQITRRLFDSQMADFRLPKNKDLLMTAKMMNEFLVVLSDMEINGININLDELNKVEKEYRAEFAYLKQKIDKIVYKQMGDTKINLSSPEQLSWLIYSMKPKDKKNWAKIFNVGVDKNTGKNKRRPNYSRQQFRNLVADNTEVIHRTVAEQCIGCHGKGVIKKIKKDGSPFKNYTKCSDCDGDGYIYTPMAKVAGFRQRPRSVYDVSESGFRTDKITLNKIAAEAEGEFKEFIDAVVRHNAVDTYLNTFVEGLKSFTNEKGFLHPKFMQAVTATGRLSSRDPNFQNQPRGKTFPIRKVVTSRFDKGSILEIDFAQLEFRTAVYLAQDSQGMEDIKNKIDVHQYTADIIGVSRQDAKAHTFKPLYGGVTGTEDEKRYYDARDVINKDDPDPYDLALSYIIVRQLCFSGMERYNAKGEFNVPFGHYKKFSCNLSPNHYTFFNQCEIYNEDAVKLIRTFPFKEGDFLFLDPPYLERLGYSTGDGSDGLHERLASVLNEIDTSPGFIVKVFRIFLLVSKNVNLALPLMSIQDS